MLSSQDPQYWLPGVLSKNQLFYLHDKHYLRGILDFQTAAGFSSIDLHLSNEGWKMSCGSIKPCGKDYISFLQDPKLSTKITADDEGIFTLSKNECYVFKLKESVVAGDLMDLNIVGQATAKSTIGRLDIIARLIVEGMREYDTLNPEQIIEHAVGDMFLEIIPISFNLRVKENVSLSQLRLFKGEPNISLIHDKDFIKAILHGSEKGEGYLSVDVTKTKITGGLECATFIATDELKTIDVWKKNHPNKPNPCGFWCCDPNETGSRLELIKDKFYLLRSKERISLPPGVAVHARAMDETLGEMRIHYAGFVHPYFGWERDDGKDGTPLIFEVRGHSTNVNLNDGERLAQLNFYRMSEEAQPEKDDEKIESEKTEPKEYDNGAEEDKDDDYNYQELKLSNIFSKWPAQCQVLENGQIIEKK